MEIFPLFLILVLNIWPGTEADANVCKSEICQTTAHSLKEFMDLSVDPCENFYKYVCGNYKKGFDQQLANETATVSKIQESHEKILGKVTEILEKDIADSDPTALKKVKELYKSCVDIDGMEAKGITPLVNILQKIGIKPSLYTIPSDKSFDWIAAAAKLKRMLNKSFIFSISVLPDPTNQSVNYISIMKPQVSTSLRPASVNLLEYLETVADRIDPIPKQDENLKAARSEKRNVLIESLAEREILNLDDGLHSGMLPRRMTVNELQKLTKAIYRESDPTADPTQINWTRLLKLIFENVNDVNLDLENGAEKVLVYDETYLENAINFIREHSDKLEMLLWYDAIELPLLFTTKELRKLAMNFRGEVVSMTEKCRHIAIQVVGEGVVQAFLDTDAEKEKQEATEMVNYLKESLENIVRGLSWMDEDSKAAAVKKIKAMKQYISHPEWMRNITKLNERLSQFPIAKDDFLQTVVNMIEVYVLKNLRSLRKLNNIDDEILAQHLADTDVYYDVSKNALFVPRRNLEHPFYGYPIQAINYGTLATTIGHKILYGFDDRGEHFDEQGNIHDWWNQMTLKKYEERAQCFIESFDDISIAGLKVDGQATLRENIADSGALDEALTAYRSYVKAHGPEPFLVGFENHTHEQLFTLAFANLLCETSTYSSLFLQFLVDKDSPNEARILGTFKNSAEFAKIWQCKEGSPMNPKTKCSVW